LSTADESEKWLDTVTVFFDRDGTLNPDPGYIRRPEDFELHPGAGAALRRLKRAGARLIVVTNQSGIARGKLTLADLELIHAKLRNVLARHGVCLDAIYYCPHHPDEGCACRKPAVGMAQRAMADFALDPSRMYLVGDQLGDIEMAKRLKARSIFVTTGNGSDQALKALQEHEIRPDFVADGLDMAVDWILGDARAVG
jgi:heptosyltransferase-2